MTTNLPTAKIEFNPVLAFDEAMNIANRLSGRPDAWTDEDLFAIYGYTPEQLEQIRADPEFTKQVHSALQELKESGGTLKQKSRAQLEYYLDNTVPDLMAEGVDVVPAKDKIALLTFLSKLSGMDTDAKAKESQGSQQAVPSFNLILTQAPAVQVIQEPRTINQE